MPVIFNDCTFKISSLERYVILLRLLGAVQGEKYTNYGNIYMKNSITNIVMKNRQFTIFTTAKQFAKKTQLSQIDVLIIMTKYMILNSLYFFSKVNQHFKIFIFMVLKKNN